MRLVRPITFRPLGPWPQEETRNRGRSPFHGSTWSSTTALLEHELAMVDAHDVVLQLDLRENQIRQDGLPYSGAKPTTPRVILSFTHPKVGPLSYPCDAFSDWQANVRAIALALESLRRVDRFGVTTRHQQYAGWKALPSSTGVTLTSAEAAHVIASHSDVSAEAILAEAVNARAAVRTALFRTHPDRRGDDRSSYDRVDVARKVLSSHHGVSL